MSKFYAFIARISLLFVLAFSFLCQSVYADGMMIRPDPYSNRWDYSMEDSQQAFINYKNGLEKLVISIEFDDTNTQDVVWIFPIPSEPNQVVLDIITDLPEFNGEEVTILAKKHLNTTYKALSLTQLYPIVYHIYKEMNSTLSMSTYKSAGYLSLNAGGSISKVIQNDVTVHEHIDKEGMTSEIVTAKTATGLYNHLKEKGLSIEDGSIPALDYYINKDYSFITSWISTTNKVDTEINYLDHLDTIEAKYGIIYGNKNFNNKQELHDIMYKIREKYPDYHQFRSYVEYLQSSSGSAALAEINDNINNNPNFRYLKTYLLYGNQDVYEKQYNEHNQRGVFVTFPTKKIFYPLLLTSVYDSAVIPTTIRVVGHVNPIVFSNIQNSLTKEYYINNQDYYTNNNFYFQTKNDKYTKILLNAPSKYLTEDLWFDNYPPVKTVYATFVAKYPIINTIFLLILCSIMAGFVAGFFVLRKLFNNAPKLIKVSLANCLSIIGLALATSNLNMNSHSADLTETISVLKQKGYYQRRRLALILLFISILVFFLPILFLYFVIYKARSYYYSLAEPYFLIIVSVIILFTWTIVSILLIVVYRFHKVKKEDQSLFLELSEKGYSTWTFNPKMNKNSRLKFILLFSISFLLISWLIIELIKFLL